MEDMSNFFDTWQDSQKKILESWVEGTKNFQAMFSNIPDDKNNTVKDVFGLYNTWGMSVGKYFDDFMKNYPIGAGNDSFEKFFKGADAYVKLYEFWGPICKSLQGNNFDVDFFKKSFDPSSYKDMTDKVFGFASPGVLTGFYEEAAKLVEKLGPSAQEFVKPWVNSMQENLKSFPESLSGDTEAYMKMFSNVQNAFDESFGKILKMPQVGKDREKMQIFMDAIDKFSGYMSRNTEFQHQMYVTSQDAMNKVLDKIAQMVKDGKEVKNYDEFFKLWIDTNENCFSELFKTADFSDKQAELLNAALDVRNNFNKLTEMSFADYPIPLRSEMDDLYKTVYDLKKKIKSLEKQLKTPTQS